MWLRKRGIRIKRLNLYLHVTLKDHKEVFTGFIRYAIDIKKVIDRNPAEKVKNPKISKTPPQYFNELQLNRVFQAIQGHILEVPVYLAANFGLRRQEVLGLKWEAIDLGKETLAVEHTATMEGTRLVLADSTKSSAGFRTLKLPQKILIYLKQLKASQIAQKQEIGQNHNEGDYICIWPDGSLIQPNYLTRKWKAWLIQNGFEHIKFHGLRHSAATLLIRAGFGQ